jgi:hypothetical protein
VEIDKCAQNNWLNNKSESDDRKHDIYSQRAKDAETLASPLTCRVVKWLNWINQGVNE